MCFWFNFHSYIWVQWSNLTKMIQFDFFIDSFEMGRNKPPTSNRYQITFINSHHFPYNSIIVQMGWLSQHRPSSLQWVHSASSPIFAMKNRAKLPSCLGYNCWGWNFRTPSYIWGYISFISQWHDRITSMDVKPRLLAAPRRIPFWERLLFASPWRPSLRGSAVRNLGWYGRRHVISVYIFIYTKGLKLGVSVCVCVWLFRFSKSYSFVYVLYKASCFRLIEL